MRNYGNSKRAFTLIELLIVVAIIAILAAIAVPNFLEAQTRAKVSRAKADMRSLITALETYRIDYNQYVDAITNSDLLDHGNANSTPALAPAYSALRVISTPIAYMTSIPNRSPFQAYQGFESNGVKESGYQYLGGKTCWETSNRITDSMPTGPWYPASYKNVSFLLNTVGPSRIYSAKKNQSSFIRPRVVPYDASNGTVSAGDILCPQGPSEGWTSMI
jgi:prepilin-type N-terminal cleavage/methylation domain-containing protein